MIEESIFDTEYYISSISFPESIKTLNFDKLQLSINIDKISILSPSLTIPHFFFMRFHHLKEIILSSKYELFENKFIGIDENNCLHSVEIPSTVQIINGKSMKWESVTSYTIPSNVTKINDYCFANSSHLTEIKGLEQIKEYGKGCFFNCQLLNKENYLSIEENHQQYLKQFLDENEIKQLEEWTSKKCFDIVFDSQ